MTTQHDKAKRWQFNLRELLALTLVVALAIGYWRESHLHHQTTARMERALYSPVVHDFAESEAVPPKRYTVTSDIACAGQLLLPVSTDELDRPRVRFRLHRAVDFNLIAEIPASVNLVAEGAYSFGGTFKQPIGQPSGLEAGIYIVRVECLDGEQLIATDMFSLEAVERAASPK